MAGDDKPGHRRILDPWGVTGAYAELGRRWLRQPDHVQSMALRCAANGAALTETFWRQALGLPRQAVETPHPEDIRFSDPAWEGNALLNRMMQAYLVHTRWLMDALYETPDMDPRALQRAAFWTRQWVDAVAPGNCFLSNPEALQRVIETGGESLGQGLQRFLSDLLTGELPMTDREAFRVGGNIAETPGQVVYRNRLVEVIQYRPATDTVYATPLLFVPPWINRFYILDLNRRKSMVRWLVAQGYTVFLISWKNPGAEMRDLHFEDYLTEGLDPAVQAVREITRAPALHAAGYCIGGTLLSCYMAWSNRGPEGAAGNPIAHWTTFTTLVDFEDPGEIGAFISEESLEALDRLMDGHGYLPGEALAFSFRMLRPNTLIWQYYINNYLHGRDPAPFDVLYWNTDNTRLPKAMHSWYLRQCYLHNRLREPDGVVLAGRPIDLGRIDQPLYCVATVDDHIAPWRQVFRLPGRVRGATRGVLSTSGHIFGIVNPPVDPPKRSYWAGDATGVTDPDAWKADQAKTPGSWWEDWHAWLSARSGDRVAPPSMGNAGYPPLADAPGHYVLES
ncbi:PHA/PHB synthase family protein [Alkalilimnicola ehrlichii MLHE-1]|uniref:Poly-beta-hydroxybutyrate polymerase domain protein n=1 Tax=Alkalilimnicola ehrlichii (strain ATCC BAA-1101 / DSM 17681 / MLHE-1) TaxID=187272 RepID=Q0AAN5_ALKEH|nr:poly-beta-hydroxybutyrate polymerase domain-containing protein [Alkalilimnicola ehrlichii]ABI56102.1 Poly-beta-hydroxybutyrate polymerase domain protein [Alkalilimnicola ehrlichii MLHE-1]